MNILKFKSVTVRMNKEEKFGATVEVWGKIHNQDVIETDEGGERFTSDNPEEAKEYVDQSLSELMEMVEQKLDNKPRGKNLQKSWRGELNNLISEVNKRAGRKMYSPIQP